MADKIVFLKETEFVLSKKVFIILLAGYTLLIIGICITSVYFIETNYTKSHTKPLQTINKK